MSRYASLTEVLTLWKCMSLLQIMKKLVKTVVLDNTVRPHVLANKCKITTVLRTSLLELCFGFCKKKMVKGGDGKQTSHTFIIQSLYRCRLLYHYSPSSTVGELDSLRLCLPF